MRTKKIKSLQGTLREGKRSIQPRSARTWGLFGLDPGNVACVFYLPVVDGEIVWLGTRGARLRGRRNNRRSQPPDPSIREEQPCSLLHLHGAKREFRL